MILLQDKYKNKEEQLKVVKAAIHKISQDDDIEFFMYKKDGTLILNNKSSIREGENFINLEDIDGKKFVKKIVQSAGYVDYLWFVPKSNIISKKITYSKKLENLGIVIGSSEFLDTKYSLNENVIDKINKEKFGKNDFIFIYEILSLSSSKNYSKLILEKNIITDERELLAIEDILDKSDYQGNIFYEYDNKLTYSSFLFDDRTFISAGVELNSIEDILIGEEKISQKNLDKKINFLIISIFGITIVFFIFSYFIVVRIENLFRNYHLRIANSQQLLIQKSKMESMGEMIGNIAHQWRQPLSQLSGFFLDIESAYNFKELDKKYLTRRINQANDVIEYMSKTIDDFKEFYNPNSKKEIFSISFAINNALKIIKSSLEFSNIEVNISVDESLHVEGLPNELSQVILNILSNSKDIAIQRKIKTPKINVFSEVNGDIISLHVEDNCSGIDEKKLEKIFEPYFTTKYNYGTGIGLYMCKVIVESKMDGKIFAQNVGEDRARFTIELKMKRQF